MPELLFRLAVNGTDEIDLVALCKGSGLRAQFTLLRADPGDGQREVTTGIAKQVRRSYAIGNALCCD